MYGRGNYASPPQFGQGLQRPMPPYLQQPGHPLSSHFQPGISMPLQPVIQQGGAPHGVPPVTPAYPPACPGPASMPHQVPPASTSNTSQRFLHPPQGVAPAQLSYLTAQNNFVSGSQNPQPPPPPPPPSSLGSSRAPPPPPFVQLTPPPPPRPAGAGFFPPAKFESVKQQSADPHVSATALVPPLPPSSPPRAPPPPSSCSSSSPAKLPTPTDTAARSPTQLGNDPVSEQVPMSESALPPPPPKPTDDNIARNIEVLCQFIAKNGPEFEEMARKNECGNPEFNFLFGGDPGSEASCAHDYFLWMKKKCGLENVLQKGQVQKDLSQSHVEVEPTSIPNSLRNLETNHSPTDSDVDMEDDITQSDKEQWVYNSSEGVQPEAVSAGDLCERHKQENENGNDLQYLRDSSPALKLSPSVTFQAGAETKPEMSAGQPTNPHSPFRLIQNYASEDSSDDNGEPCHDLVKAKVVSPLGKSGASSSHDEKEHGNMNFNSSITSETGLAQSGTCSEKFPMKEREDLQLIQGGLKELPAKASPGKYENDDREGGAEGSNPNTVFCGTSGSIGVDSVSTCKDVEKEDKKNTPAVKVDEFGRMVKEGASESESDDAHHLRRRGRRDMSRSHSRSPSDGRRRRSPRRSPRRRKERRSRSRSWSPKKRRSRSRSPHRSGGDFRGEKLRRGRVQTRECFDFLKGRCYRGASCRYLHHEADKNENSRRYSSNPDFHGGSATLKSPREHNDVKVEKLHLDLDKHDNRDLALQTCDDTNKAKLLDDAVLAHVSHHDAEKFVTDIKICAGSRELDQVPGASDESISHPSILKERPSSGMPPNEQVVHHLQTEASAGAHDRSDKEPQKIDDSWKFDSSTIQVSATCSVSDNEPYANKMSNESIVPNASAQDFPHLVSQLPPPPPLPQQATNVPGGPNLQSDYNLLAPPVSIPPQSVPVASGPFYQAPLPNQQSHYSFPSNPAWNTLPQPRPPHMVGPSMSGTPLQFQQANFPVRNDFPGQMPLRVHPGELPSHSQVGGFAHQTFHMPSSSIPAQPLVGQNLVRDERYPQFAIQSHVPASSFAPGVASQPVPFQGDSTVNNTQSFPVENQFAQQRLPPYASLLTASESITSHVGGSVSMPGYSSNPLNRDSPASFFDVGGPRISTHYNPYASTFDQPLSTRFSSAAFTQEKRDNAAGIKYDSSFGLGHAQINGQAAGDQASRQIISSSNSSKAEGQTLPKSSGDQYDPLFDSIDPYSKSLEKHAKKQDHAADNSEIMLKLSSRHNVLDVEENNKQKVVGAVAATVSLENEEFGETADAEVGAVENESLSNNNEDMDNAEGDIEIDQVKPEGKSKKTKDSRSMKLFKVAVANFVKEVLKPQWRQGNMSKEVFKTIVKKTVDKVSGAMKNHRVPKSQTKIDHYIDSSRRKLTQLVEGYVSKYKS